MIFGRGVQERVAAAAMLQADLSIRLISTQRRVEHGGRVVVGGYLKPKDLCMIPIRLAIALQERGWWIRSEIIWHKPNPMPESVYDRPTSAHEKIFLLTKQEKYFYDSDAVRLPPSQSSIDRLSQDIENQKGSKR